MPTKIYFFAEVLAFIVSLLIIANKSYPLKLKVLIPYLFITVVVEWLGYYLFNSGIVKSNHFIYNFYVPGSVIMYLYIIYASLGDKKMYSIYFSSVWLYIFFVIINLLFIQGFQKFNSYSFIVGGILISTFCVVYFAGLLQAKKTISLYTTPAFWVASGLILYYLPKTIFYTAFEYLAFVKADSKYINGLFRQINSILITTLYIFLILNFLCIVRKPKLSS